MRGEIAQRSAKLRHDVGPEIDDAAELRRKMHRLGSDLDTRLESLAFKPRMAGGQPIRARHSSSSVLDLIFEPENAVYRSFLPRTLHHFPCVVGFLPWPDPDTGTPTRALRGIEARLPTAVDKLALPALSSLEAVGRLWGFGLPARRD